MLSYRFTAGLIQSDLTGSENLSNPAQVQTASGQWRTGISHIPQVLMKIPLMGK